MELCSNLPRLTIQSPSESRKKSFKRSASSQLNPGGCKRRRTKLNISLVQLFDQHAEESTLPATISILPLTSPAAATPPPPSDL